MLTEALERMPHRGAMRLITGIEQSDDNAITCRVDGHQAPDYPLRMNGVLHAVALVELGAQAAAAHASLFGLGEAHMGLVLTVTAVELDVDVLDDPGPLLVKAIRMDMLALAASYRFEILQNGTRLVKGTVLLSMERVET